MECSARAPKIGAFNSLSSLGFDLRAPPRHISCEAPDSLTPVTAHLVAWLDCLCLERQQVERQAEGCSPGSFQNSGEPIPSQRGDVNGLCCMKQNENWFCLGSGFKG